MPRTAAAVFALVLLSTLAVAQQGARPDYARLFAMDRLHELRITISPDRFRAMQDDLKSVAPGPGGPAAMPPGLPSPEVMVKMATEGPAACREQKPGAACTAGGMKGQCTALPFADAGLICIPAEFANVIRGELPLLLVSRDPLYVPVTVAHDGRTWANVDMRYKGNSSLMWANTTGNGKIPFRLHFRTQRFHGFQELTFSSNIGDDSQLREVLAGEVLRDRGVPAPRAAFYRVHVNTGAGFEYWGLYTMVEDPADGAMLEAQFGSRAGNLYKPDGPGASWTSFNRDGFEKKTNKARADFSDVEGAIAALHAPRQDPAAWRAALEARVDVDHFLRWLAVNTVIANWDAYGTFAHNYYLYGDPASGGRLRWIPWDQLRVRRRAELRPARRRPTWIRTGRQSRSRAVRRRRRAAPEHGRQMAAHQPPARRRRLRSPLPCAPAARARRTPRATRVRAARPGPAPDDHSRGRRRAA